MKFVITLIVQLITILFLLKLAIKLVVPRPIRKLFSKSSVALYRCSCEVLQELKSNFEGDDEDDDVEEDKVVEKKVINIDSKKRKRV